MRKSISMFLACLALLTTLGACSKPAAQTENNESSDTTKPVEETELAAEAEKSEAAASQVESSSEDQDNDNETVRVLTLKGPTSMGMAKMLESQEEDQFNFTISSAVDEVAPALLTGKTDLAAVPANMASVLYNKSEGEIQVLAINTLGVLYVLGRDNTFSDIQDLKGKTLYASGKGATPEYALYYILEENGIDPASDLNIEWKSEHSECVQALASNEDAVAMLPQPFATVAQSKIEGLNTLLDLNLEWEEIQSQKEEKSALVTGVLVGRKEFIENNPELVAEFLSKYEESVAFVNQDIEAAAKIIGEFDIVPEEVAKKAIPYCNIVYIDGQKMQDVLSGYLQILAEKDAKAVGGKVPGEDFYYQNEK